MQDDWFPPGGLARFFEEQVPFCKHLGLKVPLLGDGIAEAMLPPADFLVGDMFRPALHGGVISFLADTAGGLAVFTKVQHGERVSTIDLRVDYLRPARVDVALVARARLLRLGNRVAVTETVVFHDDPEQPVAKAAAVYNVVRPRKS